MTLIQFPTKSTPTAPHLPRVGLPNDNVVQLTDHARLDQASDSDGTSRAANEPEQLSTRIIQTLNRYMLEVYGRSALETMNRMAGLPKGAIEGKPRWVSVKQIERILTAARSYMSSDDEFLSACSYELKEGYGAALLLFRTMRPSTMWELFVRSMHVVSKVSRYEIIDKTRTSIHLRYHSDCEEARIVCQSRQAQLSAFPTVWGLPVGELKETRCIGHGDDYCEYYLSWFDLSGWLVPFTGFAAGILLASILNGLGTIVVLPLLGLCLGYLFELRRSNRNNLSFSRQTNRELREISQEHFEAQEELIALHDRQRDWTLLREQQVAERVSAERSLIDRLERVTDARETTLRNLSHDIRNPLTVIKMTSAELSSYLDPAVQEEAGEVVADLEESVGQLESLVHEMLQFAIRGQRHEVTKTRVRRLEVPPLVERLRRRLRALVLNREIRVSVFSTRESPKEINIDPMIFDRIIDNVLTNAAKYTVKGSIVLELTGSPGILTVKVSDTGPGISDKRIGEVFGSGGPSKDLDTRIQESYGLGLAIVVRLLDQIGGRLEVMSEPEVGTTFWAHFPAESTESTEEQDENDSLEGIVSRVVTIRPYLG